MYIQSLSERYKHFYSCFKRENEIYTGIQEHSNDNDQFEVSVFYLIESSTIDKCAHQHTDAFTALTFEVTCFTTISLLS